MQKSRRYMQKRRRTYYANHRSFQRKNPGNNRWNGLVRVGLNVYTQTTRYMNSYANLIYKENGEVDQNASRRVVFKFRLKDTKSLDELKKMIQETSKDSKK